MSRKKNGTEPAKNSVAGGTTGLERAGRAGPGWGPGPGRGCVFLHENVRRNRLECRFGAEYRGKNQVF